MSPFVEAGRSPTIRVGAKPAPPTILIGREGCVSTVTGQMSGTGADDAIKAVRAAADDRRERVPDLDLTQQQLLQEALRRRAAPMAAAERRAEALVGSALAAVGVAAWLFAPSHGGHPLVTLGCLAGFIAAMRVSFDVGRVYTTPAQLFFVPLAFAAPARLLLPLVVIALVASRLPEVLRSETPPSRLLLAVGNAWFAVGPVLVLVGFDGADPLVLGSLLVASQLLTDFAASAMREALVRGAGLREQFVEARWIYAVDAALSPVALVLAGELGAHPWRPLALVPLLFVLAFFARERSARLESMFAMTRAYRGMALVLGDVVEADDQYTGEHCKDVVALATDVGRQLGLDAERMRNLEFGALLHDVGKIAVPKEIINKPGRLTDEEFAIVKTHTTEGQRMLDRVGGFMREVGVIVRHHHERWDGGGYPDGLAGAAIPLEARIVACCDTLNAITTDRAYRKASPIGAALAELRRCAGAQFDPEVVEAVVAVIGADADFTATISATYEEPKSVTIPRLPIA
jgi:putative nucleotidyltransferase with HDIG domain